MTIEIIKFYEVERDVARDRVSGTLHIRLPEIGLHIRGIFALKKKDYFFFSFPQKRGFDRSLSQEINYSTLFFEDKDKHIEFMTTLRRDGQKFIEQYLLENPNPLPPIPKANLKQPVIQQKKSKESAQEKENSETAHVFSDLQESAPETKKTPPIGKSASSISKMNWITPPPRKQTAKKITTRK